MSNLSRLILALAFATVLGGCGGGGDTSPVPAGRYVGTWTGEGNDTGTADITIGENRILTGTLDANLSSQYGPGGVVDGRIRASGGSDFYAVWKTNNPEINWSIGYKGKLHYDPKTGTLRGTLDRGGGEIPLLSVWTLTRQP